DQLTPAARARLRGRLKQTRARADEAIAGSPGAASELAPEGATLGDWLKRLRQNAPPGDASYEPEPTGPYPDVFERGAPTYWFTKDESPPDLHIISTTPDQSWRVLLSIVVAVGVLGGGVLGTQRRSTA